MENIVTSSTNNTDQDIAIRRLALVDLFLTVLSDVLIEQNVSIEETLINAYPDIKTSDIANGYLANNFNSYTLAVYNGAKNLFSDASDLSKYKIIEELSNLISETKSYVEFDNSLLSENMIDPTLFCQLDKILSTEVLNYRMYGDDYLTRKNDISNDLRVFCKLVFKDTYEIFSIVSVIADKYNTNYTGLFYNEYIHYYDSLIIPPIATEGSLEVKPLFDYEINLNPIKEHINKFSFDDVLKQILNSNDPYIVAIRDNDALVTINRENISEAVNYFNDIIVSIDALYRFVGPNISDVKSFKRVRLELLYFVYLIALNELICDAENIPMPTPGPSVIPFTRGPLDSFIARFLASNQNSAQTLYKFIENDIYLVKIATDNNTLKVTADIVSKKDVHDDFHNKRNLIIGYLYQNNPDAIWNIETILDNKRLSFEYDNNKNAYHKAINDFYYKIETAVEERDIKDAFLSAYFNFYEYDKIRISIFEPIIGTNETGSPSYHDKLTNQHMINDVIEKLFKSYYNFINNKKGIKLKDANEELLSFHYNPVSKNATIIKWLAEEYSKPTINLDIIGNHEKIRISDVEKLFNNLIK